jgi:hypothetical protein
MPDMVPNPLYEALREAEQKIAPLIQNATQAIEQSYKEFHSGRIWIGPTAKLFDAQLEQHRSRVVRAGNNILEELRQKMAGLPRQVEEKKAMALIKQYDLLQSSIGHCRSLPADEDASTPPPGGLCPSLAASGTDGQEPRSLFIDRTAGKSNPIAHPLPS